MEILKVYQSVQPTRNQKTYVKKSDADDKFVMCHYTFNGVEWALSDRMTYKTFNGADKAAVKSISSVCKEYQAV